MHCILSRKCSILFFCISIISRAPKGFARPLTLPSVCVVCGFFLGGGGKRGNTGHNETFIKI